MAVPRQLTVELVAANFDTFIFFFLVFLKSSTEASLFFSKCSMLSTVCHFKSLVSCKNDNVSYFRPKLMIFTLFLFIPYFGVSAWTLSCSRPLLVFKGFD